MRKGSRPQQIETNSLNFGRLLRRRTKCPLDDGPTIGKAAWKINVVGAEAVVLIYKGVGPGTHHHKNDLRITGISAASTGIMDVQAAVQHIALGSRYSPCISLTRSYGIAAGYGRTGKYRATRRNPGLVYEIDVPDDTQGIQLHDAVAYISDGLKDALTLNSYHHNGDSKFLLSVVDPATFLYLRSVPAVVPPGLGSYGHPVLTPALVALVNALRDVEILAFRTVPRAWVTNRFDVY